MTETHNFVNLAKWPIFKLVAFLEYFFFCERFFAQNYFNAVLESISACFLEF